MYRLQKAELGYLIDGSDLDSGKPLLANHTSIRHLAERYPTIKFDTLLRGSVSFGALLELYGFSAVPSPKNRGPGSGNPYFNGGFLTREHGSRRGGTIDAIQIESARSFRMPPTRRRYAKALACTLRDFVCMFYLPEGDREHMPASPGCGEESARLCSGQMGTYRQLNSGVLWTGVLIVTFSCILKFP